MLPGWNKDIPAAAAGQNCLGGSQGLAEFSEKQLGHEIQFVSTGAEREKFVLKGEWL